MALSPARYPLLSPHYAPLPPPQPTQQAQPDSSHDHNEEGHVHTDSDGKGIFGFVNLFDPSLIVFLYKLQTSAWRQSRLIVSSDEIVEGKVHYTYFT